MTDIIQGFANNPDKRPPLERLRRFEAYQLADGYGIAYDPNCRKDDILHLLRSAQNRGVFERPPVNPDRLLTAGQRRYNATGATSMADYKQKMAKGIKTGTSLDPVDDISVAADRYIKYRGPKWKWCVMLGDEMVEHGLTKAEAQSKI